MMRSSALLPAAIAGCLLATANAASPPSVTDKATPASSLDCLEHLARTFHVRIVDKSQRASSLRCDASEGRQSLDRTLDALLKSNGLGWRRLDDGTVEIIGARQSAILDLPALSIEGEPVADIELSAHPVVTALVQRATAATTLDQRWLASAPLLGFDQIGQYAPNVYGTGQSLAIRGTERDLDFYTALTITFDGIDLGTRLLDDELVPLNDVANLTLARGPRTFEGSEGSQAGAISLKTAAPAAESTTSVAAGVGNLGAWNSSASWSGPLWQSGVAATIALDRHEIPNFVHEIAVPEANVEKRQNDFARFKLEYMSDAVSGLSAEVAALALSGDSSDRWVVPPVSHDSHHPVPFNLFDRNSYAFDPVVARTHARGAAGFVRYEKPDGITLDAHVSSTAIARDAIQMPDNSRERADDEVRQRSGITLSDHQVQDWTIVAGIEHANLALPSTITYNNVAEPVFGHFVTLTDSAFGWVERSWGSAWTAGLGLRYVYERATDTLAVTAGYRDYTSTYHLPIPLVVVEWRPSTDHAFSLSYGQGYRSGGPESPAKSYSAEQDQNVELSWRAQWFGGSTHTTLSIFGGEIRDRFSYYLLDADGNPIQGRVRDRGAEFEVNADLSDDWRLRAGLGLLSSRYRSLRYLYGQPTSEAPPQTATVGVRYGLDQGWYGALDAYHAAAAASYEAGVLNGYLPAYDLLSLRCGYHIAKWDAALIVSNALGTQYIDRIRQSPSPNILEYRLGDPRRIELRLKWTW